MQSDLNPTVLAKILIPAQIAFLVLAYFVSKWLKMDKTEQDFLWFSVICVVFFSFGLLAEERVTLALFALPFAFVFIAWFTIRRLKRKL